MEVLPTVMGSTKELEHSQGLCQTHRSAAGKSRVVAPILEPDCHIYLCPGQVTLEPCVLVF